MNTYRSLNALIDAVREVEEETGWTREEIVRYVEACLTMNARDRAIRATS